TLGEISVVLTLASDLAGAVLASRLPFGKGGNFLVGALILFVFGVTTLIPGINQVALPVIGAGISSILFARAVLRDNLFNPLVELNRTLTASESHYRMLAEELSRKEKLYRTLIRHLPNTSVFLFDSQMRCLVAERPAAGEARQMEGKAIQEIVPPENGQQRAPDFQAVFEGQEIQFPYSADRLQYRVPLFPVKDEHEKPFAGML